MIFGLAAILTLDASATQPGLGCDPMTAARFDELLVQDKSAIFHDDLIGHGAVFRALEHELPCLSEPVRADVWAEFLVGKAVVDYTLGLKWEASLETALAISPSVRHDYGPDAIRAWASSPEPRSESDPLPAGVEFWLDGKPVTVAPALPGLHIVQRRKDGIFSTRLLHDEPFPEDWRVAISVPVSGPRPTVRASVLAGYGMSGQHPDDPGEFLAEFEDDGLVLGLATDGTIVLHARLGLAWDLAAAPLELGSALAVDAYVGPAFLLPFGAVALELGAMTSRLQTGNDVTNVLVPQPNVAISLAPRRHFPLEATVGGGWTPQGAHTLSRIGLAVGAGPICVLPGGDLSWSRGAFDQENSGRRIGVVRLFVGVRVGVAWRRAEGGCRRLS